MKLLKSTLLSSAVSLFCLANANVWAADLMQPMQLSSLEQAIKGDHRSDKNKARDIYRHPEKTLAFFGFRSDMTVVEVAPGSGWYTEVLAPALKEQGEFYAAFYPDSGDDSYYSRTRRKFNAKVASNDLYNKVIITDFIPRKISELAPKHSADMVLTFRNLHNWKSEGVLQLFKDAHQALKADGVLGVVEHRMPISQSWENNKKSGYFPEAETIRLAQKAGFVLADSSNINANAKDTADHPKGVWTLPPVLRLGDVDKAKYLAIGESDRMTLKFVKANTSQQ